MPVTGGLLMGRRLVNSTVLPDAYSGPSDQPMVLPGGGPAGAGAGISAGWGAGTTSTIPGMARRLTR